MGEEETKKGGREGGRKDEHTDKDVPLTMTTHGKMKTIRVTSINVLEESALGEKQTKDGKVAGIGGDEERRALQRALKGGRMGREGW